MLTGYPSPVISSPTTWDRPILCEKDAHSTLDSKYITLEPSQILWLMISHTKLSTATLEKYFYDEALRDKRMQKFIANNLTDNENTRQISKLLPELDYMNSFHQRKQLEQGGDIDDKIAIHEKYSKEDIEGNTLKEDVQGAIRSAFQLYKSMERSIHDEISGIEENINEGYGDSEEDKLYEEVEKQQLKILKKVKPMMVALPDPVGEVLAAAEKRNYLLKKLDDAQKNKGKIREQVNAIIIDNIKSSIEAGTGYDSSRPQSPKDNAYHIEGRNAVSQANNKNIYKYINESKFKAVLKNAKKSRQDKEAIAMARQIFIDAITRPEFAFVMREDFIEDDEDSHAGYAQIIAEATRGIGIDETNIGIPDSIWADYKPKQVKGMTAKQEFEQSLLPCISGRQPIEDNWFFKALIGLDKEDLNRLENPPAYENLARASDAFGAVAQWIELFDKNKKQSKIAKSASISVAAQVDKINRIAADRARIIETYAINQKHIENEHKLLYRGELFTRACVSKTLGWKQRTLKVVHDGLKGVHGRLQAQVQKNLHISLSNMDSELLPAAIDKKAIDVNSAVSRRGAPFAIDFVKTYGLDPDAIKIFNDASSGNKQAILEVTTYFGEDGVNKASSLNRQLS